MAIELFANNPATTLADVGGITSGATTLTVASSTLFPAAVTGTSQFRVLIGTEILIVTNVSGTTWTVTRGAESTTAAAHVLGDAITHIVTAGALGTFSQGSGGYGTPLVSGRQSALWYTAPTRGGDLSSNTLATGTMHAQPLVLPSCTLQAVAVRVVGAVAGSLIRLGLYSDNGSGYPGALLVDAGQVSGAASGTVAATISQAFNGGIVWAVSVNQTGTPSLQNVSTGSYPYSLGHASALAAIAVATGTLGFTMTGVTGALPGTFSTTVAATDQPTRIAAQIA